MDRLISQLSFLFKVFKKGVFQQLTRYLSTNDLCEPFQSMYFQIKSLHRDSSYQSGNDQLANADNDSYLALLLVDLSAAFNTVDHCILLDRLEWKCTLMVEIPSVWKIAKC